MATCGWLPPRAVLAASANEGHPGRMTGGVWLLEASSPSLV